MKSDAMDNGERKRVLAYISHEMRTPMNAIISFSGLALQSGDVEEIKKYLWDIQKASRELMQIINENLDGSRTEEESLQLMQDWDSYQEQCGDAGCQVAEELDAGAQVLVVDDNELNLKVATALLGQYGLAPDIATGGREAVELSAAKQYQMIFMDYMMPELNGLETMRLIRDCEGRDYHTVPVIALTANAVQGAKQAILAEGFDDYLSKPIYKKSLEEILLKWLASPIPGVRMQIGIANCGDDKDIYRSILQFIAENGKEKANDLNRFLEDGDFQNYTIAVHALKSTLANIGAMEASAMARSLELAGKEGRYEEIRQGHGAMMETYEDILMAVSAYLRKEENICSSNRTASSGEAAPGDEGTESISREEVGFLLEDVSSLLEEFRYDEAESVVREMLEFEMEDGLREQTEGLLADISNFRVEEAIASIRHICND